MTNTNPAPIASQLHKATKLTQPAGTVHLVTDSARGGFKVTFCTGRAMSWMVGTDAGVTCKACLKKAAANGVDPAAV